MRLERDGFSVDAAIAKKRPLPDWFVDGPDLLPGDHVYLNAFRHLTTCRPIGLAQGRIPWRDIVGYADRLGLDEVEQEVFVEVVYAMDTEYLDWVDKQKQDG